MISKYNQNRLTATPMKHGAKVERISQPRSAMRSGPSTPERNWKVSEMINPDGSVTIRRSVVNSEGRRLIKEEELSPTNNCLLVKDEFDSEIIGRRNFLPLEASHRVSNISSDRSGYSNPPHTSRAHRLVRLESESSASLGSTGTQVRRNMMLVKRDIIRATANTHAGSDVSTNPTRLEMQQSGLGRNLFHVVSEDSAWSIPEEEKMEAGKDVSFDSVWNESPKVLPTNLRKSQAVIQECKISFDSENSGSMLQFQQHSTSRGEGNRVDPEAFLVTPVTGSSRRDSRAENLQVLFFDSRDVLALPDIDNARDPVSRTGRSTSPVPFCTNGTDGDDEFQAASYDGSASTLSSFSRTASQNASEIFHSNIRPGKGLQMEAISEGEKPHGWNSDGCVLPSPIRPTKNRGVDMEHELQDSSVERFGQNIFEEKVSPNKSKPQQEMDDDIYEGELQASTTNCPMPKIWSERFEDHPDEESIALGSVRNFGVTVVKKSSADKVGINVGVRVTRQGNRLVVSKISPTGLIGDSNVQVGDIVTSINGYDFVAKPDSLVALDIVRNAREIRFSFQIPALDPAMDHLSLPTLPQVPDPQIPNQHSPAEASSEGPEGSMPNSGEASRRSRVSEILYLPASKVEERDFDEESYGASLDGYNASKTVTVTKSTRSESIGISFLTDHTDWGALLIVSKISPSGLLPKTDLWVGDIIMAINDVSFRDNPDAEHAAAVINDARDKVCIEFQRISGWKPALPPRRKQTTEVTETLLPDGRKIVRTETFHADKSKKVKIEEFVPPPRVNVPIIRNNSDISPVSGIYAVSFDDDFQRQVAKQKMLLSVENAEALDAESPNLLQRRDPGLKSVSFDGSFLRRKDDKQEPVDIVLTGRTDRNADAQTIMRPRTRESKASASIFKATVAPKGTDTIVLTVTKKHPSQEVGISMGTVKGILYVTRLSPTSLFVGKPILPGDTILSINNISFRKDAATKDAFAAIVNAPSTVTIKLKKTAYQTHVLEADYSDEGASKRCGIFGLLGRGHSGAKKSNHHRSISLSSGPKGRKQSIRKSKQGEPATPDTSIDTSMEDFDPFYV